METNNSNLKSAALVQQVGNNTTSWFGYSQAETRNRITGQTFTSPANAELNSISIYASYIVNKGSVEMTIHEFDAAHKTWGPVIATSKKEFTKNDASKWISFLLKGIPLKKDKTYGFQLKSDEVFVGVGETVCSFGQLPCKGGLEWSSFTKDPSENFYTYLSLAFKADLRA